MHKKKLLLLGGGYAEIPLIQAAKKLGHYVISSGNDIKGLGHKFADETKLEDYNDKKAILQLSKKLKINFICAGCNDFAALTASYVAEKLKLPGHDSFKCSKLIHHKDSLREFLKKNKIPSPNAKGFNKKSSALLNLKNFKYPIIIKPVDLTGGKGITRVNNLDEAKKAINKAFKKSLVKRIIIEKFINGSHHGISTFISNGKVIFYLYDDEYYYHNPYLVSAASSPGTIKKKLIKLLIEIIEKISLKLQLKTGIVHVQFIITSSNKLKIIEICRRAPGDLYVLLVKYATGQNYPEFIIRSSSGMDCSLLKMPKKQKYLVRYCIMSKNFGVVKKIKIHNSIQDNIINKIIWCKPKMLIKNPMQQKLGVIFFKFNSKKEMKIKTAIMDRLIEVIIIKK
jgi:phosphoribosylamine-glycine ligase